MRLKSALEDFEINTLGAVPGLLGRLSYVSRLDDGNGRYDHWGLARVYGDAAAQGAIRASHRVLLYEVLKKPLAVLLEDVPTSCANQHLNRACSDHFNGIKRSWNAPRCALQMKIFPDERVFLPLARTDLP